MSVDSVRAQLVLYFEDLYLFCTYITCLHVHTMIQMCDICAVMHFTHF
jgi:hypothetical protein